MKTTIYIHTLLPFNWPWSKITKQLQWMTTSVRLTVDGRPHQKPFKMAWSIRKDHYRLWVHAATHTNIPPSSITHYLIPPTLSKNTYSTIITSTSTQHHIHHSNKPKPSVINVIILHGCVHFYHDKQDKVRALWSPMIVPSVDANAYPNTAAVGFCSLPLWRIVISPYKSQDSSHHP